MLYLMRRKLEKVLELSLAEVEIMQDNGAPCKVILAAPEQAPTFVHLKEDSFECLLQTPSQTFTADIPYQRIMDVKPFSHHAPAGPPPRFG